MLDVANIIEDHTGIFVQLCELLGQSQVAFGGEEALHEGTGWGPQDGMTRQDEFIPKCGQHMTFSDPWLSHGDDIDSLFEEGPRFEPLDLELELRGEPLEIKGPEGFLQRQARGAY